MDFFSLLFVFFTLGREKLFPFTLSEKDYWLANVSAHCAITFHFIHYPKCILNALKWLCEINRILPHQKKFFCTKKYFFSRRGEFFVSFRSLRVKNLIWKMNNFSQWNCRASREMREAMCKRDRVTKARTCASDESSLLCSFAEVGKLEETSWIIKWFLVPKNLISPETWWKLHE